MIRAARPADHERIDQLTVAAFKGGIEVEIIHRARLEGSVLWEAVTELDDHIVGHILFTRMTTDRDVSAAALGPVAIDPSLQSGGHGSALIWAGIDACRGLGVDVIVLLGHPSYYPRFGFSASAAEAIRSPYSGSRAFMALVLTPGVLDRTLKADYPPAFDG